MSRIRTIKPEFWRHEDLSELPEATHLLAAALLNYSDDDGYFNANPKLVQAECTPLREPSVSVPDSLTMLSKVGFIRMGKGADGKSYGKVNKFLEHQRINRPTPSKIKTISIVWNGSDNAHPQISDSSPPERKGKEGKGREGNLCTKPEKTRFAYPDDFELFWKDYPTDRIMSKTEAYKEFKKLGVDDRSFTVAAAPQFAMHCRGNPDYRPVHANKFIAERRFEGFVAAADADKDLVVLMPDHPDFAAVQTMRGARIMVGKSGKATFKITEIEQARRLISESAA